MRRKQKGSDWRKQKRGHDGSIRARNGKIFARIQFIGEDGKRRDKERVARNRKHARELIAQMRRELANSGERSLDAERMTFAALATSYKQVRLIPAVIIEGKKVAGLRSFASTSRFLVPLLAHFSRKHIRTIKHSDIEEYKMIRLKTPVRCGTDLKGRAIFRPRSITCVNRELALLRSMFRHAENNDWLAKSPFKRGAALIATTAERHRDRVLSREEESRLLAACSGRRQHLRSLLLAALDTGCRKGELFKLDWPDVDFATDLIRVRGTNTKTEKERHVGMTPRLRSALLTLRESAPPKYEGRVFGIRDTIKTAWASALKEAGIKDFHFHDLRHSAITRMVMVGIPATEVMKISGHTQFSTFQRYVNLGAESARKGAELLARYLDQSQFETNSDTVSGQVN